MHARTTPPFSPARIVALVLIALAAGALAYLHFARDAGRLSVPAGARAGQLTLKSCTYSTERGSYPADCGTLVVPEDRHNAHSRLIALPVIRIRARSAHPGTPIFRLQGGPGITNMTFRDASRFAADRDVVLVGYRGVDSSVRLDCPEVVSAMSRSADFLGQAFLRAYGRALRGCATRLQTEGVDLAGYSLPERVDDLEAARRALGYKRVDLLSESAGTRTAMIYAWRHPKSVERSVMIGVNPPGHFLWQPRTTDEQIRKYSALCAQDAHCRGRTSNLAATLRTTGIPDHWWFMPIKPGNVRIATFFGLMEATPEANPLSSPMTLDSWFAASHGDASGFWFLSLLADLGFPHAQVWGDVAASVRVDAGAAKRYFAPGARHGDSILHGSPASEFLWAGGRLQSSWPAGPDDNAYSQVRTSRVPTLLIGGDLDFATPPQNAARELLPYLPDGHQVVLPNLGHTDDFWGYEPAASSHLVNTFLASGRVDTSRYTRRTMDFRPDVAQTAIAKGLLGAMLGLAALTLLSLLWLWRRGHKRGRIGRKASTSIRSLYAVVLGLGGWFGGILVVITTMPAVPLDSDLVAGLSIGIPVGLGIYLAWVQRGSTASTKATGLAAALSGALVGAWLGSNATGGLLAVLTAVAGAVAGANLILLVLDIGRERAVALAAATRQPARA